MNLPVVHQTKSMGILPTADVWNQMKEQATILVKSGFLPESIRTPEQAIAIALKGWEMGVPMMQAFSHISIVKGKPCISAELMLAQMYRNIPGAKYEPLENDEHHAVVRFKRPGENWAKFEFNTEDAKRADLLGKGTWKSYPKVMFLWRAITMMARSKFPDAIMGCSYTPEELGAEIDITDDGQIINVKIDEESQKKIPPPPPPSREESKKKTDNKQHTPRIYNGDPNNRDDQDIWTAIEVQLKLRNTSEELWPVIEQRMRGKAGIDFKKVFDEVMLERAGKPTRQPGDEEEANAHQ